MVAGLVLDRVIIAKEFGKVHVLFRGLYWLRHQFPQALVVHQDDEDMTQEVLPPFLHGEGDSM